jgi:hypothetical protein
LVLFRTAGVMIMDRVQWIEHKGKRILLINYSGLHAKLPEEKKMVFDCMAEVKRMTDVTEGRILYLSDVSNTQSDNEIVDGLRELAIYTSSSGKVEKECVVGISGLQKMLVNMINLMSKSKLVMYDTREQGLDYLAGGD